MSEQLFCYHCRVHHPKQDLKLVVTRAGRRWRCLRSLQAAAASRDERDAFGRLTSAANRADAQRQAELRALESSSGRFGRGADSPA